jgi:hypothetical protein
VRSARRRWTRSLARDSGRLQPVPPALRFALAPPSRRGSVLAPRRDRKGENRTRSSRPKGIIVARICKPKSSANRRRTPSFLRHSPIDALKQIAQLCRRDRHRPVRRQAPKNAAISSNPETRPVCQDWMVERRGFEPPTSAVQAPRALAGPPTIRRRCQYVERLAGLDENCWVE